MDVATLLITVNSGQVKDASAALGQFTAASARAEGATKRFERVEVEGVAAHRAAAREVRAQAAAYQILESQRVAGQGAVVTQTQAVVVATDRAGVSMGRFKNAIANLGLASVGIQGPLGKIVETIALLGVGSVVVTGVLAGLAAVGAVLNQMGKAASAAQKSYDELMKSLSKVGALSVVGAQLDVINRKLENMQGGGINFATRVVRSTLAGSLMGQLFGVQSEEELRNELDRLTGQYKQFFDSTQQGARAGALDELRDAGLERAKAAQATIDRLKEAADTFGLTAAQARLYAIEVSKMTTAEKALAVAQANRLTIMEDLAKATNDAIAAGMNQRGNLGLTTFGGPAAGEAAIPDILKGHGGTSPFRDAADASKDIEESWADTARSGAQLLQALGGSNDSMLLLLHNAISVGEQAEKIVGILKAGGTLSAGNIFGGLTAAAGFLTSLLGGGNEEARRREEESNRIAQDNKDAMERLIKALDTVALNLSGTAILEGITDVAAVRALGAAGIPTVQDVGSSHFGEVQRAGLDAVLGPLGTSFTELQALAAQFDMTLNMTSPAAFLESLRLIDAALQANEMATFADTFAGRLQALNAQWLVFNTTDPLQRLTEQLREAGRAGTGSPALDQAGRGPNTLSWQGGVPTPHLGAALDLATAAGRAELTGNLQTLFLQLQQGTLTADQRGGLTVQQFLDQLTGMIDLVRQAEEASKANAEALRATAKQLRDFNDSLKLSDLSPLSPVQKLSEAQRQYQDLLIKAQGGDLAAAAQLPAAAQAFLDASRAVNASGPAFVATFERVTADMAGLADMFEGMISPTEKIAANSDMMLTHFTTMIEEQQTTVAVLKDGLQQAVDKLDNLVTQLAENTRQTKVGFEGLKL